MYIGMYFELNEEKGEILVRVLFSAHAPVSGIIGFPKSVYQKVEHLRLSGLGSQDLSFFSPMS